MLAESAVNIVFALIGLLLALRFILELLGANAGAAFVAWIYSASEAFVGPLQGAFPSIYLAGGYAVDLSTIFAMIVYTIIAWIIARAIAFVFRSL